MLVLLQLKYLILMPEAPPQPDTITTLAATLHEAAAASQQRRALILSGECEWCRSAAAGVVTLFPADQCLLISSQSAAEIQMITNREVFKHLGSEADLVIYDAHDGFDADAFGAVSGVIRGGGLLLLLTPPLNSWPSLPDPEAERLFSSAAGPSHFIQRFIAVAQQAEGVTIVEQGRDISIPTPQPEQPVVPAANKDLYRSDDQANAVAAIMKVARGHRHRPLVLVSDRGRGKSSALGMAAAQLIQNGLKRIIITGPRLDAAAAVFQHARRLLPDSRQTRGLIQTDTGRLEFMAPDELILTQPKADLVLVDEAAAIPGPLLSTLLSHHARIAFATTVHGYEGTGRGFALRFNKVLDAQTPGWQQLHLQQSIRWAEDDPMEQFVFNALLLDASIAAEAELEGIDCNACHREQLQREQLLRDETLLSQVFGLLVLAHYRTRPNDLRQLLDSPGLQIHILRHHNQVVAVALLIEEGEIDEALGKQVYLGHRRLHGHLLPQSLAFHAGMLEAPQLRYLRLMRIAAHPAVQGRGLGSRLVSEVAAGIDKNRYDCLGTSFGVTIELLRFWQRLQFLPVRLGLTREHSSGTHSLIMLQGISNSGREFTRETHARMQTQLPALLSDPLRDLDPQLAGLLLQDKHHPTSEIEPQDWQDIFSFAWANRGYEFCLAAIIKLVAQATADAACMSDLSVQQRCLLTTRVIQKRDWAETVAQCGLSGRGEAIRLLRETMQKMVARYCPTTTQKTIRQSLDL